MNLSCKNSTSKQFELISDIRAWPSDLAFLFFLLLLLLPASSSDPSILLPKSKTLFHFYLKTPP